MPLHDDVSIIAHVFNDNSISESFVDKGADAKELSFLIDKFKDIGVLGSTKSREILLIDQMNEATQELRTKNIELEHNIEMIKYRNREEAVTHPEVEIKKEREKFCEVINAKVNSIYRELSSKLRADGDGIIIPGGYTRFGDHGHAMMYEIKKTGEDEFQIIIYNTGDGIQYHEPQLSSDLRDYKQRYKYKAEYCLNREKFEKFIKSAIQFKIYDQKRYLLLRHDIDSSNRDPGDKYSYTDDLYKRIDGKTVEKPTENDRSFFVSPQYSGTCVASSFNALIREGARVEGNEGKTNYNKVKFSFRKKLLDDFFEKYIHKREPGADQYSHASTSSQHLPLKEQFNTLDIEQLNIAIENFIGFVNKEVQRLGEINFQREYRILLPSLYTDLEDKKNKISTLAIKQRSVQQEQPIAIKPYKQEPVYLTAEPKEYKKLGIEVFQQFEANIAKKNIPGILQQLKNIFQVGSNYTKQDMHKVFDLFNKMLLESNLISEIQINNEINEKNKFDTIHELLDYYELIGTCIFGSKPPALYFVIYNKIIMDIVSGLDLSSEMKNSIKNSLSKTKAKDPVMSIPTAYLSDLQFQISKELSKINTPDTILEDKELENKIYEIFQAGVENFFDILSPESTNYLFKFEPENLLLRTFFSDPHYLKMIRLISLIKNFSNKTRDVPEETIRDIMKASDISDDQINALLKIKNFCIRTSEAKILLHRLNCMQSYIDYKADDQERYEQIQSKLSPLMTSEYDDIAFIEQYPNIQKALYLGVSNQRKRGYSLTGESKGDSYYLQRMSPYWEDSYGFSVAMQMRREESLPELQNERALSQLSARNFQPNTIEKYGPRVLLEDESSIIKSDELPVKRLQYPHSIPERAVFNLLSVFTGKDKDYLTKRAYQFYFERMLFIPEYIAHVFGLEKLKSGQNIDSAIININHNLNKINEYFLHNLKYFSEENKNISAYLFNIKMLLYINLYAKNTVLNYDKNKIREIKFFDGPFILSNFPNATRKDYYLLQVYQFINDSNKAPPALAELIKQYKELNKSDNQHFYSELDSHLKEMLHYEYGKLHAVSQEELDEPLMDSLDVLTKSSDYTKLFKNYRNFNFRVLNNGLVIEFLDHSNVPHRAIKQGSIYKIQRQYNGVWYQYLPENQQLSLPKYLHDGSYHHWYRVLNEKNDEIIITKHSEPNPFYKIHVEKKPPTPSSIYSPFGSTESKSNNNYIIKDISNHHEEYDVIINFDQQPTLRTQINPEYVSWLTEKFSHFESLDFIEFKLKPESIEINLKRYNLTFEVNKSTGNLIMCKSIPGYILAVSPHDNESLLLETIGTPKSYKLITPSVNYKTSDHSIETSTWSSLAPDIEPSSSRNYLDTMNYYLLDYNFSEKKIITTNTEQSLYLAYISLCKNNISLAMEYIDQCTSLGGLVGGGAESRWIHAILQHIQHTPEVQRNGYYYVIARCKTMALVSCYLQSGRKDFAERICKSGETNFYDQLVSEYIKYLQLMNNIPIEYRLTSDEEQAILATIKKHRAEVISLPIIKRAEALRIDAEVTPKEIKPSIPNRIGPEFALINQTIEKAATQFKAIRGFDKKLLAYPCFNIDRATIQDIESRLVYLIKKFISDAKKMEILAGAIRGISMDSLIDAYYDEKLSIYGLSDGDTKLIVKALEDILWLRVSLKAMELYKDCAINDFPNPEYTDQLLKTIEPIFQHQFDYKIKQEKTRLVFQARQDKCLRKEQIELLNKFNEDRSSLTQMIMGGGKTKILLPILAQQYADGIHLPVIVVPHALFNTTLADLNATTINAFHQKGNAFVFTREDIRDASDSLKILNYLRSTISDKNYLVTTSESMQSLQLKYYEILSSEPESTNIPAHQDWKANLENMQLILNLFKAQSKTFIDEVDTVLDIKKKFQYASGDELNYDSDLTLLAHDMYVYLLSQDILGQNLREIISSSEIINKTLLKEELLELLTDRLSPLAQIFSNLSIPYETNLTKIKTWLANPTLQDVNEFARSFSSNPEHIVILVKALSFYTLQINTLLPTTLEKKHNQDYGYPFQSVTSNLADRIIAIPYKAAKDPSHGSRFSSTMEEINFSYQSAVFNDTPPDICKEFLEQYHVMALRAKHQNSEEYVRILTVLNELDCTIDDKTLDQIDIEDSIQVDKLIGKISKNEKFRLFCVKDYGLDKQSHSKEILTASTVEHVAVYDKCYGFTGTPWNKEVLHDKFTEQYNLDPKSDETVEGYLVSNKTDLHVSPAFNLPRDTNDADAIIKCLFNGKEYATSGQCRKETTRALIDVAGLFKDINNDDVAVAIANNIDNKVIKYVLFYDTSNNLYALDTRDIHRRVLLTNTDSKHILQTLNCTLEECFTFYDQKHTTGVDITQMDDAHAILTVDQKTMYRSTAQGALRMRKISGEQSITIAISPSFYDEIEFDLDKLPKAPFTIHSETQDPITIQMMDVNSPLYSQTHDHLAIAQILAYNKQYQHNILKSDISRAIIAKKDAVLARCLYQIVSDEKIDFSMRAQIFKHLNDIYPIFLKQAELDISSLVPKKQVAHHDYARVVSSWIEIININLSKESDNELKESIAKSLTEALKEINDIKMPELDKEFATDYEIGIDSSSETMQKQTQNETQVQQQIQLQVELQEQSTPDLREINIAEVIEFTLTSDAHELFSYKSVLSESDFPNSQAFSESIQASYNYKNTFDIVDSLKYGAKPVHQIAFYLDEHNKLQAFVLTSVDFNDNLKQLIGQGKVKLIELFDPKLPESICKLDDSSGLPKDLRPQQERFNLLCAQAYFINGNLDLAIKYAPNWVKEHRMELLDIATKKLKNIRPNYTPEWNALRSEDNLDLKISELLGTKKPDEKPQLSDKSYQFFSHKSFQSSRPATKRSLTETLPPCEACDVRPKAKNVRPIKNTLQYEYLKLKRKTLEQKELIQELQQSGAPKVSESFSGKLPSPLEKAQSLDNLPGCRLCKTTPSLSSKPNTLQSEFLQLAQLNADQEKLIKQLQEKLHSPGRNSPT